MTDTAVDRFRGQRPIPSLERATVGDVMQPGVISCAADATATEIARMMVNHNLHCVVVIGLTHEHDGDPLLWGLISDMDLAEVCMTASTGRTAATLARQSIRTVEKSTPIREAARLMVTQGETHLIVVDQEVRRPIGIVSTMDIAGLLGWSGD